MKTIYTYTEISRALVINRSTLYYKPKSKKDESCLIAAIEKIFNKSYQTYGTRRIKVELKKVQINVSRRKISKIMESLSLVSVYTKLKYKKCPGKVNNDANPNIIARRFDNYSPFEVIVSDLTYFPIDNKWHYLCPILDLCGRKILGYSIGRNKTAELVQEAFHSIKGDLRKTGIFHTDRGSEFKNQLIENLLSGFTIQRSLSNKGTPFDNAVIEAFNKSIKVEFINRHNFINLQDCIDKMEKYMDWYNNERIHSSLKYQTPTEWQKNIA